MLEILPPCALIRVQSWSVGAKVPRPVEQALGIIWPTETGTGASGDIDLLCVGPTDWLAITTDALRATLLRTLSEAFAESGFRATDVSCALRRIGVGGAHARDLLCKGCSFDLHPQLFFPGRSARTRFAGMPVLVRCTQVSSFECIVVRSYAEYLVAWLTDAAVEFSARPPK
jgi:sarcosine oxidase, subunit gamma